MVVDRAKLDVIDHGEAALADHLADPDDLVASEAARLGAGRARREGGVDRVGVEGDVDGVDPVPDPVEHLLEGLLDAARPHLVHRVDRDLALAHRVPPGPHVDRPAHADHGHVLGSQVGQLVRADQAVAVGLRLAADLDARVHVGVDLQVAHPPFGAQVGAERPRARDAERVIAADRDRDRARGEDLLQLGLGQLLSALGVAHGDRQIAAVNQVVSLE